MENEIVYSTSELENSVDYLEMTLRFLNEREHPHRFKWLMINLHGSLYGFGVLAIKGTSPTQTVFKDLNKTSKKKREEFSIYIKMKYELLGWETDFTDEDIERYLLMEFGKLLPIKTVLERCQQEEYMGKYTHSNVLKITDNQSDAINRMIEYRNHFAHFKPMSLGIIGNYEEDIVFPILEVIELLALNSNNVLYYGGNQHKVKQVFQQVNQLRNQ